MVDRRVWLPRRCSSKAAEGGRSDDAAVAAVAVYAASGLMSRLAVREVDRLPCAATWRACCKRW